MYILVITMLFNGIRMQTIGTDTEDNRFETVHDALEYAKRVLLEGFSDNDDVVEPQAHVINTATDIMHVYKMVLEPRKYTCTAK